MLVKLLFLLLLPLIANGGFVYSTCKRGFEKLLKFEISSAYPDLKFSYSRPGLITWKINNEDTTKEAKINFNPNSFSLFIRSHGNSVLSQALNANDIIEAASKLSSQSKPLRLHVFGREEELALKSEHPDLIAERVERINTLRNELLALNPALFHSEVEPLNGDLVLDVIVGEKDEKHFVGSHIHDDSRRSGFPNNQLPISMPLEAPSRAYMKIEEGVSAFRIPLASGDVAVEIGSAPGGCVYSLLQRGLKVWGVDPCPSDRTHAPILFKSSAFTEVRCKLHELKTAQIPQTCNWVLCDANIDASEAIPYLRNICKYYYGSAQGQSKGSGFKGLIYTCKIGDGVFSLKPDRMLQYLDSVKSDLLAAGCFTDVTMTTLPSHRQEILIYCRAK